MEFHPASFSFLLIGTLLLAPIQAGPSGDVAECVGPADVELCVAVAQEDASCDTNGCVAVALGNATCDGEACKSFAASGEATGEMPVSGSNDCRVDCVAVVNGEAEARWVAVGTESAECDGIWCVAAGREASCSGDFCQVVDGGIVPVGGAEATDPVGVPLGIGNRAAVFLTTEEAVAATLHWSLGENEFQRTESFPRTAHLFILRDLPIGETLRYWVSYDAPSGLVTTAPASMELANAFTPSADGYRLNLLMQASERVDPDGMILDAIPDFAERIYDATDGHVRVGTVILVIGDLETYTDIRACYTFFEVWPVGLIDQPTCRPTVDVQFTWTMPLGLAGISHGRIDHGPGVQMNMLHHQVTTSHLGFVLTHEVSHYVFDMSDKYIPEVDKCFDPETLISVMGLDPRAREFDDPATPCPNGSGPVPREPSWSEMRSLYADIPARPEGPAFGPAGDGGLYRLHVLQ